MQGFFIVKHLKNRNGVASPCRTTCTVCGDAPCYAFLSIQLYNRNNINLVLTHSRNRTREMQKFATAVQAGIKQLLRILALSEPQDEV